MDDSLSERVASFFKLDEKQSPAALERERDVVVTAGAGSGKTRTLVARYVSLLAEQGDPRRIVAITFTDKAALEMRSRVRAAVAEFALAATEPEEKTLWMDLNARMDSARISTIHSLCLEIQRAHPAEAGIDPKCSLMDDGNTCALQLQVVQDTLSLLAEDRRYRLLFEVLSVRRVQDVLLKLLENRLDADWLLKDPGSVTSVLADTYAAVMLAPEIVDCANWIRGQSIQSLEEEAGDKLAGQLKEWHMFWQQAEAKLEEGSLNGCIAAWISARRSTGGGAGKKDSIGREIKNTINVYMDQFISPLYGEKKNVTELPDVEFEEKYSAVMELVAEAFYILQEAYRQEKARLRSLDYDDLEGGAVELLKDEAVRRKWQAEVSAMLVDEFQDTNARQREIVEALAGDAGKLFVVGDARQSIYRFRRADVTVFRQMKSEKEQRGGLGVSLDITYRTHAPLLLAAGDILSRLMGTQPDSKRPYYEPFSPMKANRQIPPPENPAPHLEVLIGVAKKTNTARPLSARMLVQRLIELKEEGQIEAWSDVVLLFRSTTAYPEYEDALESAGIPFVTVAGRGFYARPEIRDLLNILRALANPADDLALAGLLRSPAFGVSDEGLFHLRWRGEEMLPYKQALEENLAQMDPEDRYRAGLARDFLHQFWQMVDRMPVAELLKQVVDRLDYRAMLAEEGGGVASGRLWRNLDKLLRDAHKSHVVNVRDFLDYLKALDDVGAREGEATTEALGAVSLMTIHKSKGLEYKVVVLADASNVARFRSEPVLLLPSIGAAVRSDPESLEFYLAKQVDKQEDETERQRLLYVALTRAKDKLLICGHGTNGKRAAINGWLSDVLGVMGLEKKELLEEILAEREVRLESGQMAVLRMAAGELSSGQKQLAPARPDVPPAAGVPIYRTLIAVKPAEELDGKHGDKPLRGRVTGEMQVMDPLVLGSMVHKAVEVWSCLSDGTLEVVLNKVALEKGLAELTQRTEAVSKARELLARLQAHSLWQQIHSASERHHEVSYSILLNGWQQNGVIDLLYKSAGTWHVTDLKTDSIRSEDEKTKLIRIYQAQVGAYCQAVREQMGVTPAGHLCFMDDNGKVSVVDI